MEPLIQLTNVTTRYQSGTQTVTALQSCSLSIHAGEFVCITGRSGSGKSTLINLMGGLDRATSGQVCVGGMDLGRLHEDELARWRRTQVGVLFQFFHLLPSLTALENVLFPMTLGPLRGSTARQAHAQALLAAVGLTEQAHAFPSELSGGQQQRVALARALANAPPLLLADEPTGNLDSTTAADIQQLFATTAKQGSTVVLATHDPDLVQQASRVLTLADGQIAAG
jgi:putative ABC transport system ATP-binding protein